VPPGPRKCFIKDNFICQTYSEAVTQLTHTQVVIPPASITQYSTPPVLHTSSTPHLQYSTQYVHNHLGHLGVKKTLAHVKTAFYWAGNECNVESWMKNVKGAILHSLILQHHWEPYVHQDLLEGPVPLLLLNQLVCCYVYHPPFTVIRVQTFAVPSFNLPVKS